MIEAKYKLITRAEDVRLAVEELSGHQLIGLDTETTDLDPYRGRLRLVQLSTPDMVFIFDLFAFNNVKENEDLNPLREILAAARPVKIAHNTKFDAKWLRLHLGVDVTGVFDTLLASQIISAGDTEERHSLAAAVSRYLNETLDKSEQLSDWSRELTESQLRYATLDAAVMMPLREKMVERLKKDSLVKCAQLEFECVMPLAHLELAGIFLDASRWREQLAIVKQKREKFADELQEMLSEGALQASLFGRAEINLDSHTKVTDALKRLGVPMPENTRGWQLQPLANDYPVVAKLLEYRTVQKALTSYGENILEEINPVTGRIHADFYQIGAPTGRMACLTGDTLIATPEGFKRMEDISVNDFVKTSFGYKRVQYSWMSGVKKVFLVKLKNGQTIRATADHRFLTGLGNEWRRLDELKVGDNLFVSLKTFEHEQTDEAHKLKVNIPDVRSRKPIFLPETLSVELCELMGLIIADGFLGKRHERPVKKRRVSGNAACYDRVCMAFGREDKKLIERVISNSIKIFGYPFKEVKSRSCGVFQLASTKVAEFFAAIGLSGNAHTKKIPDVILQSCAKYQTAFLRGLYEGDGHYLSQKNHGVVGLTSVNRTLLSEVQIMLSDLGIYATLRIRKDISGFNGAPRHQLTISKKSDIESFMDKIGFISDRKNQKIKFLPQQTDGVATPFIVSGAKLFKEAKEAGVAAASREGIKPFSQCYKRHKIKGESVEKLIDKFGILPSLKPVKDYMDLKLRHVEIESIVPLKNEKVYDITVEDVHEFIANGIVVHNCSNPNIQQVPHGEEYRRCFRAPEGRKFAIADFSQIELRILADFSKDEGFMEAFKSGADLHRTTAAQVFNVAPEDVTSEQRSFSKRLNFGVVYGIGAPRFAMMTGVSTEEAEGMMRRYFQTYKGLDNWLRNAGNRAVRDKKARTASGRLIKFRVDESDRKQVAGAKRNGMNAPIQGCVHGDTRIFEKSRGYVPIKELDGRDVCVWDGKQFSKACVLYSGKKQLVKIELRGGHYIECSPDHRFLVIDTAGRKYWRKPTEFAKQNYIALTEPLENWSEDLCLPELRIGKARNANKTSIADALDSPFGLGIWLERLASDGSLMEHQAYLLVAEHEEVILPEIKTLTQKFGHVTHKVKSGGRGARPIHFLTLSGKAFIEQLKETGVKKGIPDFAWRNSRILSGYLQGMFDGDGCVNPDGAILTFGKGPDFYLNWAREIQQALLLFGIRSRINRCADRINICVLKRDMPLFCDRIGFLNPEKHKKASAIKSVILDTSKIYGKAARIKSVEFTNEWVDMYDVVNSETECFMANGLITHNSSADILKRSLRLLYEELKETNACIVNVIHDEIVVECDEQDAPEIAQKVESSMVAAGEEYVKSVPIKVDAEIKDEWVK